MPDNINDLDLTNWREYGDIITDSLWNIPTRDKSGAHNNGYHGNFIPQIPHQLMLRFTKGGDVVLDPFLGHGTTLMEALTLGRHSIGVELEPDVAQVAQENLAQMPLMNELAFAQVLVGDSTSQESKDRIVETLTEMERDKVQLILMHPPYHDIIKFGDSDSNLCNASGVEEFVNKFGDAVANFSSLLERRRHLAIVIGDKYTESQWVPLAFMLLAETQRRDPSLVLKSIVIKNMVNNRAKRNMEKPLAVSCTCRRVLRFQARVYSGFQEEIMNTHVLIVDQRTLQIHLQYGFVGTGKGVDRIDFNNNVDTAHRGGTENILASMMADGLRMREGDQIIFYLQQPGAGTEGKFFGVFRTVEDGIFIDDNDGEQYLQGELEKSLTCRALIEPAVVYQEGVTEWEALDEIRNIVSPYQMLWSLIYRKLKGNRGNTMITPYEAERLTQLIRHKNNRQALEIGEGSLSFNPITQRIVVLREDPPEYHGRWDAVNVLPRLMAKYNLGRAFEPHLQAYITQHLGLGVNASLDEAVLDNAPVGWLGNEVSCGVGMQRIDVMAEVDAAGQRTLVPMELKAVVPEEANTRQLQRYVDWIEQYYLPNRISDIRPVLVAGATTAQQRANQRFRAFAASVGAFNEANPNHDPLRYVEFEPRGGDLRFYRVW